jgi:uncharacterized membrane protein YcaP (DUF421 family)
MCLLAVGSSFIGTKSHRARRVLDGVPIVIARNGVVFDDVMRRERITTTELLEAARGEQVADLSKIDLVVVEADGRFSFLRADRD